MDHVSAVTTIDYSPTGKEFVSGGYDKSVRIFEHGKVNSESLMLLYYLTVYVIGALSVKKPVRVKKSVRV
jgi:WD40 repeat protein